VRWADWTLGLFECLKGARTGSPLLLSEIKRR
jgi:hypothetical protein